MDASDFTNTDVEAFYVLRNDLSVLSQIFLITLLFQPYQVMFITFTYVYHEDPSGI